MYKHLLLLLSFIISAQIIAQDDCQEVDPYIVSSTPEQTPGTNPSTGEAVIYYDLCIGDTLTIVASANFPENNISYEQTLENTTFEWLINGVDPEEGSTFTFIGNTSGGYVLSLTATDSNGCTHAYPLEFFIRVSTVPTIDLTLSEPLICPGEQTIIGGLGQGNVIYEVEYETGGFESEPCEELLSDTTHLPDGNGVSYTTSINLECFGAEQTLTDINDIVGIYALIEHSYTGDLDISITAPNGTTVDLFTQYGGGNWFGSAIDDDNSPVQGVPEEYGWSPNPNYNGTMIDAMNNEYLIPNPEGYTTPWSDDPEDMLVPDTYYPVGDLTTLLGTPLNGPWTITVTDNIGSDDGWIFEWGITMNPAIIPPAWNYNNFIVDQYWQDAENIVIHDGTAITILPEPGTHTYTYEIVDNFNCSYTESTSITATPYITVNFTTQDDICTSETGRIISSINGGTPGYDVDWNNGTFASSNLYNIPHGEYEYTITDDLGCEIEGIVTVGLEMFELDFSSVATDHICETGYAQINVSPQNGYPPYNYDWGFTAENTPTIGDLSQGTYSVNVTDNYGCIGTEVVEVKNIDVHLTTYFDTDYDHCDQGIGAAVITPMNGQAPHTFYWEDDENNSTNSITYLKDGNYDVSYVDDYGCEGDTTITIENIPGPVAYFEHELDTVVYTAGEVVFINYSTSEEETSLSEHFWSFGNGDTSTEIVPMYNFNQIGHYEVQLEVTDNMGCKDTYISTVVAIDEYLFWYPTAFTPNGDRKNDIYNVVAHNIIDDSFEMFIFDRWGKQIFHTEDIHQGWDGIRQDNGINADTGTYNFLVRFNTKKNEIQEKTGSFIILK